MLFFFGLWKRRRVQFCCLFVIAEEIQVFPYHVPVKNLQVVNDKLIVVSDHEVRFPYFLIEK